MKLHQFWQLGIKDMKAVPLPRQRTSPKRRVWILVIAAFIAIAIAWAYLYPPPHYKSPMRDWLPAEPARELTDEERASRVVFRQILTTPPVQSRSSKIAFMFLTPGTLPFERLWEKFFEGHDGKYTIYVHASREKPEHVSPIFIGREIHSEKVTWGQISMVDAERRLLANALQDIDNQHFVLLSDSFIDCFYDPGPHGNFRYSQNMLPEVTESDFRKGSQWFSVKRQHALMIVADSLYYTKFKIHCRPGMEDGRNCYADEHYLPTLFHMMDPDGIANWSVTHVDWSEGKWHPKAYRAQDVTFELLKNITSIDMSYHVTSDSQKVVTENPCLWNGAKRPCYLFARKFYPESINNLMTLFSNYTLV
ncbi:glycosyltransferase BC10-like isoform X2 [Panicum virgatum]|uniref:Core-2/I-branching beta-1,6-N-acetylglucosaminyltransferase family protein n=1 Tax=Panicum virgatum TaxID=38727 RepID=A0A8T0QCQ4_PANVG|nr:glycosyltransferase BC10-like isoform X2 [Panicum virgatum]KAG2568606.1 hypothetical protein PVAP13_7NG409500 [Panicum virgatum]